MSHTHDQQSEKEDSVLITLQKIKDGTLDPRLIDKDLRKECIKLLIFQGQDLYSIAQLLKRNERTVRRDIEEIRQENAVHPDIELAQKIIGDYIHCSQVRREHLMRLARKTDGSIAERAQADYLAHRIDTEVITRLQTLGYLPLSNSSQIFHHLTQYDTESLRGELTGELTQLQEVISEEPEPDSEIGKSLQDIKQLLIHEEDKSNET